MTVQVKGSYTVPSGVGWAAISHGTLFFEDSFWNKAAKHHFWLQSKISLGFLVALVVVIGLLKSQGTSAVFKERI